MELCLYMFVLQEDGDGDDGYILVVGYIVVDDFDVGVFWQVGVGEVQSFVEVVYVVCVKGFEMLVVFECSMGIDYGGKVGGIGGDDNVV